MFGPFRVGMVCGLFLRALPFSSHVKEVCFGDAGTLCTDGECSAATDAGRRPRRSQPSTPRPRPPSPSSTCAILKLTFTLLDSPPTPPLDFGHRLTLTFFLQCIAS